MELPELGEDNSASNQSLLLSSVKATAIEHTKLKPGSEWISVGNFTFIAGPEFGSLAVHLRVVSEWVLLDLAKVWRVKLSELLLNVDLSSSILPSTHITMGQLVHECLLRLSVAHILTLLLIL